MSDSPRLKLAIQKSGRLNEGSLDLIRECGIKVSKSGGRLKALASNFPLEILYLRDDDIPGYVEDGVADIGIVGENEVAEKQKDTVTEKALGFSRCRLCLAIPRHEEYKGLEYFQGQAIATSYPHILEGFLKEKGVNADIHEISGSVEIAPSIGLATAIFDIVSTGSTLLTNGLKEVEEVMRSEAVLIKNSKLSKEKQQLLDQLLFRINSVQQGKQNKYVLLNAPNEKLDEIIDILPGMRSPSVLPLANKDWSSVHSVIQEDEFWQVIEQLKNAGAEGILVVPIEKMIQ